MESNLPPFYERSFKSKAQAFAEGFNESAWAWGLVLNQGHGMDISPDRATRRLKAMRARLLRKVNGNRWRAKAKLTFWVFQHGAKSTSNRHFHVLARLDGPTDWTIQQIADQMKVIDSDIKQCWEKPLHVDCDWQRDNRYHSYVSRFAQAGNDDWFII